MRIKEIQSINGSLALAEAAFRIGTMRNHVELLLQCLSQTSVNTSAEKSKDPLVLDPFLFSDPDLLPDPCPGPDVPCSDISPGHVTGFPYFTGFLFSQDFYGIPYKNPVKKKSHKNPVK